MNKIKKINQKKIIICYILFLVLFLVFSFINGSEWLVFWCSGVLPIPIFIYTYIISKEQKLILKNILFKIDKESKKDFNEKIKPANKLPKKNTKINFINKIKIKEKKSEKIYKMKLQKPKDKNNVKEIINLEKNEFNQKKI
ncbi:MAG: hypothetical protein HPAVJP_3800 [Candidatus Hepatoplasma vulgare]|nr:MAG: hypothetical protein HPAVJP_3800 [Candidatus Hepatoplasma sp.]